MRREPFLLEASLCAAGRAASGPRLFLCFGVDTSWLEKKDRRDFVEYGDALNLAVANQRLAVLCTYPSGSCGA
jgi:hypothetical protein